MGNIALVCREQKERRTRERAWTSSWKREKKGERPYLLIILVCVGNGLISKDNYKEAGVTPAWADYRYRRRKQQ
jgi:hypothetical protein